MVQDGGSILGKAEIFRFFLGPTQPSIPSFQRPPKWSLRVGVLFEVPVHIVSHHTHLSVRRIINRIPEIHDSIRTSTGKVPRIIKLRIMWT